jgi:ferritin-like metal-binding protein YciE
MADENRNEVLTTYTSDVHALVSHGLKAIHRQVEQLKDVKHQDAKTAVALFERTLKHQQAALEDRVKALGGSATGTVKDAVSTIAGVAAGLIDAVRPAETAKAMRDDHTYFSHLGISWLMLYTTAASLNDAETAALAERGYQDTTQMIMHVDRILPKIVVEELGENEALMPLDVQHQTSMMVKNAWNRKAPAGV